MRIIKITPIVKKRVKQMIFGLFPEFSYVRVTNRGLAILKANRWSLKREIVPVTDLCMNEIPRRIAQTAVSKGLGESCVRLFNEHISVLMQLRYYNDKHSLFDYVYNRYVIVCMEQSIVKPKEILAIEERCMQKSFRLLNTDYIYGVGSSAKKAINRLRTNKVYQQIEKLKAGLPKINKPVISFRLGFEV